MIEINYTYEVVNVSQEARVMEVVYTAENHDPILVGVQLPTVDQDLEQMIRAYAPWGIWEEKTKVYQVVAVGLTGSFSTVDPAPVVDPTTAGNGEQGFIDTEAVAMSAALQADAIREIVREELSNAASV
jgi:hypothetical protein